MTDDAGEDTGRPGGAGDPRGGEQPKTYHTADPRDLVVQDGVATSGPGGAPQDRPAQVRGAGGAGRRGRPDTPADDPQG